MGKSLTDKSHGSGLSHLTRKQEPHYRLPTVSQVHSCESTLVSAVGIGWSITHRPSTARGSNSWHTWVSPSTGVTNWKSPGTWPQCSMAIPSTGRSIKTTCSHLTKKKDKLGMVASSCIPGPWEVEARGAGVETHEPLIQKHWTLQWSAPRESTKSECYRGNLTQPGRMSN